MINRVDNSDLFAKLKDLYGIDMQCLVACEECGELIQAISKIRRNPSSRVARERLIDEIADVSVMLEQIMYLFGIFDTEIADRKELKLIRQRERVAGEQNES